MLDVVQWDDSLAFHGRTHRQLMLLPHEIAVNLFFGPKREGVSVSRIQAAKSYSRRSPNVNGVTRRLVQLNVAVCRIFNQHLKSGPVKFAVQLWTLQPKQLICSDSYSPV